MSGNELAHNTLIPLVFIAVADPLEDAVSSLANVIGSADTYNHSILSAREIEHGVRDLSRAGLISANGLALSLTAKGRDLWKTISERDHLVQRRIEQGASALGSIRCVGAEPGWSLSERAWEDAYAEYSPQFALELRRLRKNA